MGMRPIACVAAVGLPGSTDRAFTEGLYGGMRGIADRFDVPIAGGDVTSWRASRVVVCVTALGRSEGTAPVLRSGASPRLVPKLELGNECDDALNHAPKRSLGRSVNRCASRVPSTGSARAAHDVRGSAFQNHSLLRPPSCPVAPP